MIMAAHNLCISYGDSPAVTSINLAVHEHAVSAIIGPSGCGKSTLLRHFNRLNEFFPGVSATGEVCFHGEDIYAAGVDAVAVRRQIGMVFQQPNPFPTSVFENIAWGLTLNRLCDPAKLADEVEASLRLANLWDEVHDRLELPGTQLSGGQQQRLCIARALALRPEVLLMDEPTSALDPRGTSAIEALIRQLKGQYTIVLVTHDLEQARRVADYTALLVAGRLIEFAPTSELFNTPREQATRDYLAACAATD